LPPSAAPVGRKVAIYAAAGAACLLVRAALGGATWRGDPALHAIAETGNVMLALAVAAIALVRFYSRRSTAFLLVGAGFLSTALLDAYHAAATSGWFLARHPDALAVASPWSWFASRLFLAVLIWASSLRGRGGRPSPFSLGGAFALMGGTAALCLALLTVVPLPGAYVPGLAVPRPAELLPGLLFAAAFVNYLRRGGWRRGGFEHWLVLSLVFAACGQIAFMAFSERPFDALLFAGQAAKSLGYVTVLTGLLISMYALFRRADRSVAELARINAALQREIAERTRAEEDRDRFFGMSLDLICIAGTDGYFKQLNPAWERTLGYSLAELTARPYLEFVHPDDRQGTASESQRLVLGGATLDFENRYMAKDGTYRWLSWRATPVPGSGLVYAVARDVSERKKIEQMKDDFISIVSHELRTPLTSIRGALGLLAGGVVGGLPDRAAALVDIADKNSERLVRLINDILDVENIESGQMRFRFAPLDLTQLVEQAIEANRAYAQPFGVELRLTGREPGLRVMADADRLLQVLANLLSNAAKFSPRGRAVEVEVTRRGSRACVVVTDSGRGVPPEFRHRVFEKFAQADASSTRQKGGTGLGLSITRAIVERHGGRIWFESEPGVRTSFLFELPEWCAPEPLPLAPVVPRVLVCEDDPDVARLLAFMLEREGYGADVALSANEARLLLGERAYAAMTLDLRLPDQDGASFLQELRRQPGTRELPIVVVSARAEEGRMQLDGGAIGVVDWLVKPIDPEQLAAAVRRAVLGARRQVARVLHVEDDVDLLHGIAAILGGDAEVAAARNLKEAREQLARTPFDLVILDLALPDGSGLELLPLLGRLSPPPPVIIFSAHEVDLQVAGRVESVLVKSQTTSGQLLQAIRAALPQPVQ
jgi:PAS domain S-box-containing protein